MKKPFPPFKKKKGPPEKPKPQENSNIGWWILVILVVLVVLGIVIFLIAYPWPHSHYYRDAKLVQGEQRGRVNCTVGEKYDKELDLCAPITYLPTPISLELMDKSKRACSSFFDYMGGQWVRDHVNENRAFTYAHRKNQKRVHDIIRDPSSGPIYQLYRSCLDTLVHKQYELLDKSQVKHVREHVLGAFQSHGDLPVVFARLLSYGFTSPFMISIEPHPTEPRMVPLIRRDVFGESGEPSVADFPVTMIYDFQQVLKKLNQWHTDVEYEGSYLEYVQSDFYKRDMTTMRTLMDGSPKGFWELYLRELNGYSMEEDIVQKDQPVWLLDRIYVQNLLHNLEEISLREWRAYIEFTLAYHTKKYVPQLPSDSYFRLHNPIKRQARFRHRMFRLERDIPSEHTCLTITHKLLPGTIGNVFVDRYMNREGTKQKISNVVENVRDSFIDMVKEAQWLSRETQDTIVDKLRAMIVRVIHPNFYEEEPFATRLSMESYLRNLNIIRRYVATRNFELWTKGKPNRDLIQRFGSPITTVNAFYSPVTNTISIFGGILTEPFYNESFSDIGLYAGIGMIAAHELAHGLDNRGRWYDLEGSICLEDPWKQNETNEFNRRMQCLIREYEAPFGCINAQYGEQTIGEDLSDLNGLRAAYKALKKHRGGKLPAVDARQFFQVFAQLWMENYDQSIYCDRVDNDEHAVAMFRVDKTLRQMPEFWEAFNCKEGDKMMNKEGCNMF
jgi:predicted metalloendopeptidase